MRQVFSIAAALMLLAATAATAAVSDFDFRLARNTAKEQAAVRQLERLFNRYDISRFSFTYSIMLDEYGAPHSFPQLTLNAYYLDDDAGALSTFLHEQLHWYGLANQVAVDAAVADLKTLYPRVPVGRGEGARDEASTYLHLIVGLQEYDAAASYVGRAEAARVLSSKRHYRWINKQVLENTNLIRAVLQKHGLDKPSA